VTGTRGAARIALLMVTWVARLVAVILVIATFNFVLVRAAPGDPAMVMAGQSGGADPKILDDLRKEYYVEIGYDNGPWLHAEHSQRLNLFARRTWSSGATDFALTFMGYRGQWDSTDQIPQQVFFMFVWLRKQLHFPILLLKSKMLHRFCTSSPPLKEEVPVI